MAGTSPAMTTSDFAAAALLLQRGPVDGVADLLVAIESDAEIVQRGLVTAGARLGHTYRSAGQRRI
ncbi:hypothetical protein ABIF38_001991 [Bradyrhizobium japonicum]|jgi:hypothetical protein|uniref:Uncharacterized protein n=3 Tax=Bradyrhizobium elkanii TaxID=29448 RepID=A0ABV4FEL0_BRAEL|nr:hypothetical protein [Bradyrhizobium elkanii]OIM93739.1 hypothetical protein BLN97_14840 [Bradyrhizobium elkanii]BBB95634.1 hypothetical protein BE61_10550 [Bradyrhizobium elkanii USDA 61]